MDARLLRKYRKLAKQTVYVQPIGCDSGMLYKTNVTPMTSGDYYKSGNFKHPFVYSARFDAILPYDECVKLLNVKIREQILGFAKNERAFRNKLLSIYRDDIGNHLFFKFLCENRKFKDVRNTYYETGVIPINDKRLINQEVDKEIMKLIRPFFNKWVDEAIEITKKHI